MYPSVSMYDYIVCLSVCVWSGWYLYRWWWTCDGVWIVRYKRRSAVYGWLCSCRLSRSCHHCRLGESSTEAFRPGHWQACGQFRWPWGRRRVSAVAEGCDSWQFRQNHCRRQRKRSHLSVCRRRKVHSELAVSNCQAIPCELWGWQLVGGYPVWSKWCITSRCFYR